MDYRQNELVREFVHYISTHTVGNASTEKEGHEEEIKWAASLFFAKAINLAQPRVQFYSLDRFTRFKADFEQNTGREIDSDNLLQKFWLRNILGNVKLAGALSSLCYRFSKISKFREELKFLCQEFPEGSTEGNGVLIADFTQIRSKYERENRLELNVEGLFEPSWISISDEKMTISNMTVYFKPYLTFWDDFDFLQAYKAELFNGENKIKIDKADLAQLHMEFNGFYARTPPLQKLIKEKVFSEIDGAFVIDFYNTEIDYWISLKDRTAAHYWQLLIERNDFSNDHERVKMFLNNVLYWGWPSEFLNYSINETKKRFLDAAVELVINDPDMEGVESEFKKVSLDGDLASREAQSLLISPEDYDDLSLNNADHFELLETLDNWERKAHRTYLYNQSSRGELGFLVKSIVTYDCELDDQVIGVTHHYKRIRTLLEKSLTRPTLLWNVKCFITMSRREIIPYLIADTKYMSFGFQLIDRLGGHVLKEDKVSILKELWLKAIDLGLHTIRSDFQSLNASKIIFQIYRQLNGEKYEIPYNRQRSNEKLSSNGRADREKAVLTAIEESSLQNHKTYGGSEQYIVPALFDELVAHFTNFKTKSQYYNGTVSFPMLQWDGLAWLMKCFTYWKYKTQFKDRNSNIHLLTTSFFNLYRERIELQEIKKYNYALKWEENGIPHWSEKIERLTYIEWIYPVYFFYQQGKLTSFLEPRFDFASTTEYFHKENNFKAEKLRTHIGVLLQVLRQLVLPIIPYGFEKRDLMDIKSRIEQQIIDYLRNHIEDIPKEGRVDLFNYSKEHAFRDSENEALLPQIARSLNWFDKKEQIIEAINETKDIIKILVVAEWVISEGLKQKLIDRIRQSDIQSFLEETNWIPQVQQILLRIRQYPELINEINQVIDFWEKNVSKEGKEYEVQLYQTKMLLAYFRNDEEGLNTIKKPSHSGVVSRNELSFEDHKQFYRALIRMENDPISSYGIFKQLSSQYPQYPVFSLNQMAANIEVAKKGSDNLDIYREAWEEWKQYSSQHVGTEDQLIDSKFDIERLYVLLKLEEYEELDKIYSQFELPSRMLSDILDVKVESLIKRKRIGEALHLLEEAENYHSFSNSATPGFISELRNRVNGINDETELQYQYNRIFNSPPSKLIRIFPEKLNGRTDVSEFIVNEVALATSSMLDKIYALPKVLDLQNTSKENRFNDLVQLALGSRISSWGWSVKDQTRKAFSTGKMDVGEIDLDIRDINQKSFMTCEAFILRDDKRVIAHLKKLIAHYTHERKALLTLVYFMGNAEAFDDQWEKFYRTTLKGTPYPKGYEIDTDVVDVTKDFDRDHSGIRIGKACHKKGTVIYHLFININYQLTV